MKTTDQITGWFYSGDFDAYNFLISTLPHDGVFVECGAWLGKSSSYLCDNARPDTTIYIVDSWLGSANEPTSRIKAENSDLYSIFLDNMGDRKFIPIRKLSHEAVELFQDETCDVVFIDMEHTYEAVIKDIDMWFPKVKVGGYISGHDYGVSSWPDVKKAVQDKFDISKIKVIGNCWIVKKENI